MTEKPVIVAVIESREMAGYGTMHASRYEQAPFDAEMPYGNVALYAWSDGIITWKESRE